MRTGFALPILLCAAIAFVFFYDRPTSQSQAHVVASDDTTLQEIKELLQESSLYEQAQNEALDRNSDILQALSQSVDSIGEKNAEGLKNLKSVLVSDQVPAPAPELPPSPEPAKVSSDGHDHELDERIQAALEAELIQRFVKTAVDNEFKSRYPSVSSSGMGSTGSKVASGGSTGGPTASSGTSYGSSGSAELSAAPRTPLRSAVKGVASGIANYQPRWSNRDGKSRLEHVQQTHGLNTSGMTMDEILREQDAYHDIYGPGHPVTQASPMLAPATIPVAASPRRYLAEPQLTRSCPPGGCPPQRTSYSNRKTQGTGWFPGKLMFGK